MRRKLVAGNWKMHGTLAQNADLLDAVRGGMAAMPSVDCAVCVPFPYLAQAQQKLSGSNVKWGAQDVHQLDKGAYTGEVSAAMLRDFACRYVIVGHSERRALYGESSHLVAEKYLAAQQAGLVPILCVGETLAQRESEITEQVVAEQLDALIRRHRIGRYFRHRGDHGFDVFQMHGSPGIRIRFEPQPGPDFVDHVDRFVWQ